jgi:hypothetical protein
MNKIILRFMIQLPASILGNSVGDGEQTIKNREVTQGDQPTGGVIISFFFDFRTTFAPLRETEVVKMNFAQGRGTRIESRQGELAGCGKRKFTTKTPRHKEFERAGVLGFLIIPSSCRSDFVVG